MTQPFFPCTISAQSRNNEFLTIKTMVRKTHQNNGHTGSLCLDKAVLAQAGGGGSMMLLCISGFVPDVQRTSLSQHVCSMLKASDLKASDLPQQMTDNCLVAAQRIPGTGVY